MFALALDPIVGAIRRNWGWPRSRSVLLVAGGAIVLVTIVVVGMGPQAAAQARNVTSDIPQTVREFYDLPVVGGWLEDNDAATKVDEAIEELPGKISDRSVTRTVEGMVGGALSTVLVLAVTVAVLLDGEYLVAAVHRLLPHRWVNRADEIGHVFYMAIAQYFAGSLAVAALMGVVVLALCLIFGVPLAPLAALWAMITDLIPQVGGFLGGALLGLLALTQGAFVFVVVVRPLCPLPDPREPRHQPGDRRTRGRRLTADVDVRHTHRRCRRQAYPAHSSPPPSSAPPNSSTCSCGGDSNPSPVSAHHSATGSRRCSGPWSAAARTRGGDR